MPSHWICGTTTSLTLVNYWSYFNCSSVHFYFINAFILQLMYFLRYFIFSHFLFKCIYFFRLVLEEETCCTVYDCVKLDLTMCDEPSVHGRWWPKGGTPLLQILHNHTLKCDFDDPLSTPRLQYSRKADKLTCDE